MRFAKKTKPEFIDFYFLKIDKNFDKFYKCKLLRLKELGVKIPILWGFTKNFQEKYKNGKIVFNRSDRLWLLTEPQSNSYKLYYACKALTFNKFYCLIDDFLDVPF